jgi:hypothetical protein
MDEKHEENGQVDVETMDLVKLGVPEDKVALAREKMLSFARSSYSMERARHVAKPGTYNLPPLLEERRLKWEIPDGVFRVAQGTVYDRILIWQIPLLADCIDDNDFIGGAGGTLYKSDQTKEKETREAPRGVVVGAGLQALDVLRAHGMDLGHIVYFCKNTVYTIKVDYIGGHDERVSLARMSDLVLSEDVALDMRSGAVKVQAVERMGDDGVMRREHLLVDGSGIAQERLLPPSEDDL